MTEPLFEGSEWSFDSLQRAYDAIEAIGVGEMGYNIYPNQLEIVSSEQMIDAYVGIGMPIQYNHWSFGKHFIQQNADYKGQHGGLSYEMIINSNPCISYNMEDNSMTMQTMVLAHAAMGHNAFFKNNYMYKLWTDAEGIIDYLIFAKDYIAKCEQKEGQDVVERFLDSCHALDHYGVNRYKHPAKLSLEKEMKKQADREDYIQSQVDEFYSIIPKKKQSEIASLYKKEKFPVQPEENILYMCEKYAPNLERWQREIIRIVRKMSQYFYPQMLTKTANEGFASWSHYTIMKRLHEKGLLTDGSMIEFLSHHAGVIHQPTYDKPWYSGLNPYRLGFEIFSDIERMCKNPTEEDKFYFPSVVKEPYLDAINEAMMNYRDESFIRQFLSPTVVKNLKLFHIYDEKHAAEYIVENIQDDKGFENIRERLANMYEQDFNLPIIEVANIDKYSKKMTLRYNNFNGRKLENLTPMVRHVRVLWGMPVEIEDKFGNSLISVP